MGSPFRSFRVKLVGFTAVSVAAVIVACATTDDGRTPGEGVVPENDSSLPPPSITGPDASEDAAADVALDTGDSGRGYTYGEWGEYGGCNSTCGPGERTRTRECKRFDGIPVNCQLCGGECTSTTPCFVPDSGVSCCDKPRAECCPPTGQNVGAGDLETCNVSLQKQIEKCQVKKPCLWVGPTVCSIGGGSDPTYPGATASCE